MSKHALRLNGNPSSTGLVYDMCWGAEARERTGLYVLRTARLNA
jgi:hypothetical protein